MKPHPNDPKKEAGSRKTPLHLLPPYALAQTALAHAEGARRYGLFNWRTNKVCATTYIGAILRHLTAWQDGEDIDADSGLSHIAKIGACCNILLDAGHCGTLVDDRSKVPMEAFQDFTEEERRRFIQSLMEPYVVEPKTPFTKLHAPIPSESAREAKLHGIGKVMVEIEAARKPPAFHPPTPCCNYMAELTNDYPVFWNPFNKVVQCHNCGHQYPPSVVDNPSSTQ